jgi:C-terminal processing protease CtpA/Prc
MKKIYYILLSLALLFVGCEKQPEVQGVPQTTPGNDTYLYVNTFAWNVMDTYYLWIKDISKAMDKWDEKADTAEPISTVEEVKYKDDKWTMLTDDFKAFTNEVSGISTSYGYELLFYPDENNSKRIVAVIKYVYPDSPASAAGLKRGDTIVSYNGTYLPYPNTYDDLLKTYSDLMESSSCQLGFSSGKTVSMTAVNLTENPVNVYKVLDDGNKKIGYLHYTSFTAASVQPLIEACKFFKSKGIKELVLDLRYNGGGWVGAEEVFMSMLAPKEAVDNEEVFSKEIYNELLTEHWGEEESKFQTIFDLKYDGKNYHFDTSDANIGLDKIYAIVTDGSASASEALICCLKPFMPVELIGEKTYGKYCAGIIYGAEDWYDDMEEYFTSPDYYTKGKQLAENWGIYVMISRFADRDGNTLCMPNGISVDIAAEDDLQDGYQLGEANETMLKVALERAGFNIASQSSVQRAPSRIHQKPIPFRLPEKPGMVRFASDLPSLK